MLLLDQSVHSPQQTRDIESMFAGSVVRVLMSTTTITRVAS